MSDVQFWEDFKEGDAWESPGRTVTETDVVQFAMLSGDWMGLHTDAEVGKASAFGERVAHGLLGLSIASGLFVRTQRVQSMAPNVMALLGLEWKFTAPIRFGDTVHLKVTVNSRRETSKKDQGILTLLRELINQKGEVVQVGTTPIMVRRRPA